MSTPSPLNINPGGNVPQGLPTPPPNVAAAAGQACANAAREAALSDVLKGMRNFEIPQASAVAPSGDSALQAIYDDMLYQIKAAQDIKTVLSSKFKIHDKASLKKELQKLSEQKKCEVLILIAWMEYAIHRALQDYAILENANLHGTSINRHRLKDKHTSLNNLHTFDNNFNPNGEIFRENNFDPASALASGDEISGVNNPNPPANNSSGQTNSAGHVEESTEPNDAPQGVGGGQVSAPAPLGIGGGTPDLESTYDNLVIQINIVHVLKNRLASNPYKIHDKKSSKDQLRRLSEKNRTDALIIMAELESALRKAQQYYDILKGADLHGTAVKKTDVTNNGNSLQRLQGFDNDINHKGEAFQKYHFNPNIVEPGGNTGNAGNINNPNQNNTPNATSIFIQAAKALLQIIKSILKFGIGRGPANAIAMIAKYSTAALFAEQAKNLAETGMTEEIVRNNPLLRHEALQVDQKAAGVKGELDTMIQYWKDVLIQEKQANKDDQKQAFR